MDANSTETAGADALFERAQEKVAGKDLRGALRCLFELFLIEPLHAEGLAAAARLAAVLGSRTDADQFEAVARNPEDPQALYDLGFSFVEQGLPGLGVRYLELCQAHAPDHPLVRYELGYALYLSGRLDEAVPLLRATAGDSELAGPEPFSARLLLVECHLRRGDLMAARRAFEALEPAGDVQLEAQRDAMAHTLARAARAFATRPGGLGPSDWHFVLHGGVVLRVDDPMPVGALGVHRIADLLLRLEALLRRLDLVPDAVQFAHGEVESLAGALARRLEARAEAFDSHADGRKLVLAKDPSALASLLPALRRHEEDVDLFTLTLDPRFDQPILPDVVGCFSGGLFLPWEDRFEIVGDGAELGARRVAADPSRRPGLLGALESVLEELAGGEEIDEVARRFAEWSDLLVLGRPHDHPARRVFTARPLGLQ